jgi:hypothetical protein
VSFATVKRRYYVNTALVCGLIPKEAEQSAKERFAGLKTLNILSAYSRVVAAPDKLESM